MMRQDDEWAIERRLDAIAAIRIAGYQRLARDTWRSPAAAVVDASPAYATDAQAVAYVVAQGWVAGVVTEPPASGDGQ